MNEKELTTARNKYKNFVEEKRKLEELKQSLLASTNIKDCETDIEFLNNMIDLNNKLNIINRSFSSIARNTKNSNKIFVSMGIYPAVNFLTKKDTKKKYMVYRDLETCKFKYIKSSKSQKFEDKNKIIYLDDNVTNDSYFYLKNFNELRAYFFGQLVDNSQEEVIKQLVKEK